MVPTLETERLRLRGWREEDHSPFADFCANEATARFMGGPCSREDAWRRIAIQIGHWALRGYGSWVLEEKASGDWVGYSGLWRPDGWPEPEVMWGLAADAQGRGYATEAAQRARVFAYGELGWTTAISCIDAGEFALAARRRAPRRQTRGQHGVARIHGRHLPPPGPRDLEPKPELLIMTRRRACP